MQGLFGAWLPYLTTGMHWKVTDSSSLAVAHTIACLVELLNFSWYNLSGTQFGMSDIALNATTIPCNDCA